MVVPFNWIKSSLHSRHPVNKLLYKTFSVKVANKNVHAKRYVSEIWNKIQ